jgi:hypothetical protein
MSSHGIKRVLYYCPKINRSVLLSLDYSTLTSNKIYTTLECESKSKCIDISDNHMYDNFDKCTAHTIYIEGL